MFNINGVIDNLLINEAKARQDNHKARDSHWPTSASIVSGDVGKRIIHGECLLKLYRSWTKVPETNPFDIGVLQKIGWGTMVHDWVTEKLEKVVLSGSGALKSLETEQPFKIVVPGLDYPVSGKIDNILNKNIGLEIKSSFGKFFFGTNGLFKVGPKKEHVMQAFCYLKGREDIEEFILFYIARDIGFKCPYAVRRWGNAVSCHYWDLKTKQEQVFFYPEINWTEICNRWADLEACLKIGQAPPPDFQFRSKWPCSGCVYYDLCYPGNQKSKTKPEYDQGEVVS